MIKLSKKDKKRLLDKIKVGDGCWEWQGTISKTGYGVMSINNKSTKAHRASYEVLFGEIPERLVIDHLCRNKICVNPWHLEPVTIAENNRRAAPFRKEKTHCPSGHEYTPENTSYYYSKRYNKRYKSCKTCESTKKRNKRNPKGNLPFAERTHCKEGHEFTEENTYITTKGNRACRICLRVWKKAYKVRIKLNKRLDFKIPT